MADKPVEHNPEALEDVERAGAAAPATTQAPAAPTVDMRDVPLDKPATATTGPTTTAQQASSEIAKDLVAKLSPHEWKEQMALASFLAAVELIQASIFQSAAGSSMHAWAVSAGAISFVLTFCIFVAQVAGKELDETGQFAVSLFLFLWWFAAAVSLTFFGPFQTTCYVAVGGNTITGSANGFFAVWALFLVSLRIYSDHSHRFTAAMTGTTKAQALLGALFLSSAVVMGAGISPCTQVTFGYRNCAGYPAFAISLGTISMAISLVLIILYGTSAIQEHHVRLTAMFLFLWWAVGTCVVTFGGPFFLTGNGYFGSFVSTFFSYGILRVTDTAIAPAAGSVRKQPAQAQAPPAQAQPQPAGNAI